MDGTGFVVGIGIGIGVYASGDEVSGGGVSVAVSVGVVVGVVVGRMCSDKSSQKKPFISNCTAIGLEVVHTLQ